MNRTQIIAVVAIAWLAASLPRTGFAQIYIEEPGLRVFPAPQDPAGIISSPERALEWAVSRDPEFSPELSGRLSDAALGELAVRISRASQVSRDGRVHLQRSGREVTIWSTHNPDEDYKAIVRLDNASKEHRALGRDVREALRSPASVLDEADRAGKFAAIFDRASLKAPGAGVEPDVAKEPGLGALPGAKKAAAELRERNRRIVDGFLSYYREDRGFDFWDDEKILPAKLPKGGDAASFYRDSAGRGRVAAYKLNAWDVYAVRLEILKGGKAGWVIGLFDNSGSFIARFYGGPEGGRVRWTVYSR